MKDMKRYKKHVYRLLFFLVSVLLLGFSYEMMSEYNDRQRYAPAGKMIKVNRHFMCVCGKGRGNVTVVCVPGLRCPSAYVDFYTIYEEISKYTRIVVYDRPGHGWSETTDEPRYIDSIVAEIHTALVNSGEKPPYILVSHSLGSLEAIRFTQTYKKEVSGIVMIDSGSPEYYKEHRVAVDDSRILAYKLLKYTGIARIMLKHTNSASRFTANNLRLVPGDLRQLYISMMITTADNRNIADEARRAGDNAKTVLAHGRLGDLPLIILTSALSNSSEPEWEKSQKNMTEWSTQSTQIVVKGAGHSIHQYAPEVINEKIQALIRNHH